MAAKDALKEIIAKKKERILLAKEQLGEEEIKNRAASMPACRNFRDALNKPRAISLIAEVKKQSPSAGVICEDFDPVAIAKAYEEAGAQAISVLTEEDFFGGNLFFMKDIKNTVNVPVLRKDFILEPYQVYESRVFGADAVLLIADMLAKEKLAELIQTADSLGLSALVEVHNEKDIKKALEVKAQLIGINNRDLHTLEVDPRTTERLYTLIPKEKIVVVESGLKSSQDILFLKVLGVKAVLVGESILRADDRAEKIKDLMGW